MIVVDDMADRADVLNKRSGARNGGSHIMSLSVRGRHSCISFIVSTQALNLCCLPIRKNVRNIVQYRARSQREVDGLVEELAAVYNKDTVRAIYEYAVNDQPYSFLNVKLDAADKKDMFWLRWESRIIPEDLDVEESEEDAESLQDSSRAPQRVRKPRSVPGTKAR